MTGHATSSRPARRQRTKPVDLASGHEKPVAATRAKKTGAKKTGAKKTRAKKTGAKKKRTSKTQTLARVIDFANYSQSAWDLLNTKYVRSSSSKAYEKASDVVSDIGKMFDTILKTVKKAGGHDCSYGTRKNAVETMTEIMTYIVTAPNDEIRHQARNEGYEATEMEEKLLEMTDYFDEDELAQLDEEGWTDKVRELADGYSMYEGLNEVVEMLEGDYEEEGEEGEDSEDSEEGEEGEEGEDSEEGEEGEDGEDSEDSEDSEEYSEVEY